MNAEVVTKAAAKQRKSNGTEGMTKPKKRTGSNEDSGNDKKL